MHLFVDGVYTRLDDISGRADPRVVEALTEFGERVGRAFQLGDDLLDITADAAVAGKAPGGDLRAGVRTLPILYLLRDGGPDADRLTAVLDGNHDNGAVTDALDVLRRSPPSPRPAAPPLARSPTRSSTARSDPGTIKPIVELGMLREG